jgi:hypothetical protein
VSRSGATKGVGRGSLSAEASCMRASQPHLPNGTGSVNFDCLSVQQMLARHDRGLLEAMSTG